MGPKHSIGPGRIESRVRGLTGEKVPRRRRWPRELPGPLCIDPPESACVMIEDRAPEDWTPGFHPDRADSVHHHHSNPRSQDRPHFGVEEAKGSEVQSLGGRRQFPSAELGREL